MRLINVVVVASGLVGLCLACELPSLPTLPDLPPLPALYDSPLDSKEKKTTEVSELAPVAVDDSGAHASSAAGGGIDTERFNDISDHRGSWFKKRHWLLRARELQEKINAQIVEIQGYSSSLYGAGLQKFDSALDDFYRTFGVEKGKIDHIAAQIEPYFNVSRDPKLPASSSDSLAQYDSSIGLKYQQYFANAANFAQVKADIAALSDLEKAVSDRIAAYDQYAQQALDKASDAQKIISDMFSMINHERAREAYYQVEGLLAHIEAIKKFLKNDLGNDFQTLVDTGIAQTHDVGKTIDSVKSSYEQLVQGVSTAEAVSVEEDPLIAVDNAQSEEAAKKTDNEAPMSTKKISLIVDVVKALASFCYGLIDLIKLLLGL